MEDFLDFELIPCSNHLLFSPAEEEYLAEPALTCQPYYDELIEIETPWEALGLEEQEIQKYQAKISTPIKKSTHEKKAHSKRENQKKIKRWNRIETDMYQKFVIYCKVKKPSWSEKSPGRKRVGYYTKMSDFIKTKSPEQCKSHDQKFEDKYQATQEMLDYPERFPFLEQIARRLEAASSNGEDQCSSNDEYAKTGYETTDTVTTPTNASPSVFDKQSESIQTFYGESNVFGSPVNDNGARAQNMRNVNEIMGEKGEVKPWFLDSVMGNDGGQIDLEQYVRVLRKKLLEVASGIQFGN